MRKLSLANGKIAASDISLGCMRIAGLAEDQAVTIVKTALDEGINFFDHADIYGGGRSEEIFAKAANLSPSEREKIYLQSQCSIRGGFFDFSIEHILTSVDKSLQRLNTEYLRDGGVLEYCRLKDICRGSDITLTREEWYDIYRAPFKTA